MTELGNRLKEAREAKGLSLADIQELTKIQKRYLVGIEEGNYDMMPGKFYIRAFIKQYAEAVGVDSEELFEQYKGEIPSAHEDEIPQRATKAEQVRNSVPAESSKILEYLPKILVTAFVIGAVLLVWILIPKGGSDKEVEEETVQVKEINENVAEITEEPEADEESAATPKQEEQAKEEKPAKSSLEVVGTSGRKTTYSLTDAKKFEISVTSNGETWIDIEDETGKKYFSNILRKGETQTFDLTGQSEAKIVIGFSPDTVIAVNGETLEYKLAPADQIRQDIIIQTQQAAE